MNIYVGNLSYNMTDSDLSELFEEYGPVKKANIIMDRETGRSKGFGFVEMDNSEDGKNAISELDGKSISGRNIKVNEARPRPPRNDRGGGGGHRGGGHRGGGGGYNNDRGGQQRRRDW